LDDNPRIARFGTKTGVYGDSPKDQETPAASADMPPSLPNFDEITGLSQDEDYAWRTSLSVGDLVDAKDKTGNWYQVSMLSRSSLSLTLTTRLVFWKLLMLKVLLPQLHHQLLMLK
jgi:hypothetical protein